MVNFSPKSIDDEAKQNKNKMSDSTISTESNQFFMRILELLYKVWLIFIYDETLEIIFFHFCENLAKVKIDFEIFKRCFS